MATKEEIDELLRGAAPLPREKPTQRFCIKVVGKEELGKLSSTVHCDKHTVEKKEIKI